MSTAATLMSLLPQLKTMEHSIITMIVEITSKLASLTEAEIFVLVQDSEQRLISGSSSLVELYLAGNLVSRGDDVEMEAPPSSVKLKRRHSANSSPADSVAASQSANASSVSIGAKHWDADAVKDGVAKTYQIGENITEGEIENRQISPNLHRISSLEDAISARRNSASPSSPKKPKMTSPTPVEETLDSRLSNDLSSTTTTTTASPLDDRRIEVKIDAFAAEEVDLTAEDEVAFARSDDANVLISGDDDIDFYPISHQRHFVSNAAPLSPLLPPQSNSHSSFANSFLNHHPHHHHALLQPSPLQPSYSTPDSSMLVDFDALNLPVQKMNFLKSVPVTEVEKLFEKGTAESKVLTSVFYDFGKSLSGVFRLKDDSKTLEDHLAFSKSFLNANLNAFLELFPSLQSTHLSNVRVHDMKPEAFLRLSARNGFKRGLNAKRF